MLEEAGMMMVPSSYLVREPTCEKPRKARRSSSKANSSKTPSDKDRSSSAPAKSAPATPVKIPSQRKSRGTNQKPRETSTRHDSSLRLPESVQPARPSFSAVSVDALLAETSIPLRRKPKPRKSQRLPAGDHVTDFSRILLDDIQSRDESRSLSASFGNPQFDLLFGANGDNVEDAMFLGSELSTPQGLSIRSLSTESMPSMETDEGSPGTSFSATTTPSPGLVHRGSSYKRARVFSSSEDCVEDHPLNVATWEESPRSAPTADLGRWSPETRRASMAPTKQPSQKSKSFLRSNLTASLRALKSAASTVSNLAANSPANRPDDFLTRSIFTFSPELTDDKRPPPSSEPPSAALRRYLNPDLGSIDQPPTTTPSTSPSDFYTYDERPSLAAPSSPRPDIPNSRPRFPASIQLQTYLPPTKRSPTGSASSPPRFGSPNPVSIRPSSSSSASADSTEPELDISSSDELLYNAHTSFHASPILSRQREPRENPDFLRILVCEMQMRRKGKFVDNQELGGWSGRAIAWLPPRQAGGNTAGAMTGKDRWEAWTV